MSTPWALAGWPDWSRPADATVASTPEVAQPVAEEHLGHGRAADVAGAEKENVDGRESNGGYPGGPGGVEARQAGPERCPAAR